MSSEVSNEAPKYRSAALLCKNIIQNNWHQGFAGITFVSLRSRLLSRVLLLRKYDRLCPIY